MAITVSTGPNSKSFCLVWGGNPLRYGTTNDLFMGHPESALVMPDCLVEASDTRIHV